VNYKTYYDLYWFRPLLGGNSHTSSNLILKMKRGYNGVSRELEKFTCEGKNDLIHPAWRVGVFYGPSQLLDNNKLHIFTSRKRFTWPVGPKLEKVGSSRLLLTSMVFFWAPRCSGRWGGWRLGWFMEM
jgi:hypothetical protein